MDNTMTDPEQPSSREARRAERRSAYAKAYYQRKKAEDPDYVKKLYERARLRRQMGMSQQEIHQPKRACRDPLEQKVINCRKRLTDYAYKSMETIRVQFPEQVEKYFIRYPFEECGHGYILKALRRFEIYKNRAAYADCYDAGMLAYLYSVHRCAAMGCDYTVPYIRKMIRIFVICALVVYHDARNLCRANAFREVRLDADISGRLY